MKTCKRCGETKPKELCKHKSAYCKACYFYVQREYREANKERLRVKKVEYRLKNPDVWRARNLMRDYGLSLQAYAEMLKSQNNVCAVCKKPERSNRYNTLCVDHDHQTGKVRGLLCNACNRALGLLQEDFDAILTLAKYLQEHKDIPVLSNAPVAA